VLRTGLVWTGGAWIAAPIAKGVGPRGAIGSLCALSETVVPSVFSGFLFSAPSVTLMQNKKFEVNIHCCLTVVLRTEGVENYTAIVHSGVLREYDADSLEAI